MQSASFIQSFAHKHSIITLYRSLIRHTNRLSTLEITQSDEECSKDVQTELFKANIDRKLYVRLLKSELFYIIQDEFRVNHKEKINNPNKLRERIVAGLELQNDLENIKDGEVSGVKLIEKLVEYRQQKQREQNWKAEYLKDPGEIDKSRNKDKPTLLLKQIESRSKKPQLPLRRFKGLTQKDKENRIKMELIRCEENTQKLLRRYLKKLQTNHEIPIPHLLPYTPESALLPIEESVSTSISIPGSTRKSSIAYAYDQEYIDAIIKPEMEFDINKCHYLENLQSIVNEKGPFKVQIQITEAGPIPVPYIRMPYPRLNHLKEVALDIKKMMRLVRLKTVWNASGNDANITEPQFSDGSYSVRGSKGFGENERLHPKIYYDLLAQGEGLWEYLIDASLKNDDTKDVASYVNEWSKALEDATNCINEELTSYYQKYNKLKSSKSPLLQEQKILQHQMNVHYNEQLKRYMHIIRLIEDNKVFKHSEIVNSDTVTKSYDEYLIENDSKRTKKNQRGMPSLERIGMGKHLGDYLDDVGYHNFKLGVNFDKKLKF
ncbi:unnamed protein product [Debaryomyces fabryi]|nr:unnamed protein product [Debaryomyces fabryi]